MPQGTSVDLLLELIRQIALIETVVMPQLLHQITIVLHIKLIAQSRILLQLFVSIVLQFVLYFLDYLLNVNHNKEIVCNAGQL